MNKQKSDAQTYKFNIFWRLFTYLSGVLISVLSISGAVAAYINSYPVPLCAGLFLFFMASLGLFVGLSLIATPSISFLQMDKDGFTYRDTDVSVKGRWVECFFKETDIPLMNQNNFLAPLNYEVKYHHIQYLLRSPRDRLVYDKVIPILYFGVLSSKPVKQKIREYAPYLFNFLLTEMEFLATIAALDQLLLLYKNKEMSFPLFSSQYYYFYIQYIVHGKDTVNDFFTLMTRHSDKVAYHTAVWNEIIKPQIPDYEIKYQQDITQLENIKNRYE